MQAASTVPFAIPMQRVEINKLANPPAKTVRIIPRRCNIKANTNKRFMPIISTKNPPIIIAKGNPQKAVPAIIPNSAAVKLNCTPSRFKIPARMPKESDVTKSARQLATKSWFDLLISYAIVIKIVYLKYYFYNYKII